MRTNLRAFATLAACAAIAAAVPSSSGAAAWCKTGILVLSGNRDVGLSGDPGALLCDSPAENHVDGRIISPAADEMIIRYTNAVRYNPNLITATLNGAGFRNRTVYLARTYADLTGTGNGTPLYESSRITIAPGASGCVKITVKYVRTINRRRVTVLSKSTAYRTVDATC